MQTFAELKQKLAPDIHNDLDSWYEQFQAETEKTDIHLFLAYLSHKGLLRPVDFASLRGDTPVDISEMETLAAGFTDILEAVPDDSKIMEAIPDDGSTMQDPSHHREGKLGFDDDEATVQEEPVQHAPLPIAAMQPRPSHVKLPGLTPAKPNDVLGNSLNLASIGDEHSIIEGIGKGAMGVVYLARDKLLGRKVAFKQVRPDRKEDNEVILRFLREAQVTAQLDHPGIAPVYRLVKGFENLPGYTMKVIEGDTLEDLIKASKEPYQQGGVSVDETAARDSRLEIFLKVCDAMSYAHNKGVLHRDLKPKNIMVGRFGEVYVVDWGLARLMFEKEEEEGIQLHDGPGFQSIHTKAGQLMGTPQYMSPEQAEGRVEDMDARVDIYALGIILYELVFLRPAIDGTNLLELVEKILKGQLNDMNHLSSSVSVEPELVAIIEKATANRPADRYQTVQDLGEDLRRFFRGEPILAMPDSRGKKTKRLVHRHRSPLLFGAMALVLALLGTNVWSLYNANRLKNQQAEQKSLLLKRISQSYTWSQHLDQQFAQFEGLTQALGAAAQLTLQLPTQPDSNASYPLHRSFKPDDLQKSVFYRDNISLGSAVIKLPPRVEKEKVRRRRRRRYRRRRGKRATTQWPAIIQTRLQQLSLLQSRLRSTLFQSLPVSFQRLTDKEKNKVLLRNGLPLVSAFVATKEGLIALYPGRKGYPKSYDPRKRSWFQEAKKRNELQWSQPYFSAQKLGAVLLSCTLTILDKDKQFLGVAAVDVHLNSLAENIERMTSTAPWLQKTYLLDKKGNIVLQTGERLPRRNSGKSLYKSLSRKPFPSPLLRSKLQTQSSGHHILRTKGGTSKVLIFQKLRAVPWFYVTVSEWPYDTWLNSAEKK
ncbi:MAG: hypothetical protein EP343_20470 [Deltaproteobacteria bacterium]|nr:MAG: hypothetical protein EP343_20470 [Deltaproteobacteria bacterium]